MSKKPANPFGNRVLLAATMVDTPRTRIRQRIRRLLEEHGKTQREFARFLGHGDQWASNLLRGEFTLSLDELDRVAAFFNVPPGWIVRVSDEPWELSPTEMRVVRALRMLPPSIRDHLVTLADYLIGTTPEEIELLRKIRQLKPEEVQTFERWIGVTLLRLGDGSAPEHHADREGAGSAPGETTRRTRGPRSTPR